MASAPPRLSAVLCQLISVRRTFVTFRLSKSIEPRWTRSNTAIVTLSQALANMNKSIRLRLLGCALLLVSLMAAPADGRTPRRSGKASPSPTGPVISVVSGNSITVTDEKSAKAVTVSPLTEVTINGQKAGIADLKPGMTVSLVLSSPTQASRIAATSK